MFINGPVAKEPGRWGEPINLWEGSKNRKKKDKKWLMIIQAKHKM
jgi:hypothetical protein